MKVVIAIIIVVLLGFGGYKVWEYWTQTEKDKSLTGGTPTQVQPESLPGLPSQLEPRLQDAQKRGPDAFEEFIDSIKKSPLVKDPRLAWIELDYVVMVASKDPAEAKRVFRKVKERVPADSPVYQRVQFLAPTFQ